MVNMRCIAVMTKKDVYRRKVPGFPNGIRGGKSLAQHSICSTTGKIASSYIQQVSEVILSLRGVAVEVDDRGVIASHVAAGVGISIGPEFFVSERDRIRRISFKDVIPPRRYGAMTRRDESLGVADKRFPGLLRAQPPHSSAVA